MPKTEQRRSIHILMPMLWGILTALAITMLLLLLCSVAISTGIMSLEYAKQMAIAACAVGTFIGGLIAVRRGNKQTLLVCIGVGIVYFLFWLLLAPLFTTDVVYGADQLPLLFACICSAGIAGLLGRKRKKRRH